MRCYFCKRDEKEIKRDEKLFPILVDDSSYKICSRCLQEIVSSAVTEELLKLTKE